MNREQKRAIPPQATRQLVVSNQVGLERMAPAEAELFRQAGGDPDGVVLVKFPVPQQNVAITGVAPDGTVVLGLNIGIPAGLLRDQGTSSRLLDRNGVPTGAAAVVSNALAGVVPMLVLGVKAAALSDAAGIAMREREAGKVEEEVARINEEVVVDRTVKRIAAWIRKNHPLDFDATEDTDRIAERIASGIEQHPDGWAWETPQRETELDLASYLGARTDAAIAKAQAVMAEAQANLEEP